MNQLLLLSGNPKGRRSAAQRAATARMLAANGRKGPARKRGGRKSAPRRSARGAGGGMVSGVLGMVKTGAIGGGGAVVVDVGMGFVAQQFPTQGFTSRINADGSINPLYYAVKGLLAYALGRYGSRLTPHATTMAAGAYTVMLYDVIKAVIPASSVPMGKVGYLNPARVVQGGVGKVGRVGAYEKLGAYMPADAVPSTLGPGASAASVLRLAGRR